MLLTEEERNEVFDSLPRDAKVGDERKALCKAQLKKVVKSPEWRYNLSALAYLELTTSPLWKSLLEEVK